MKWKHEGKEGGVLDMDSNVWPKSCHPKVAHNKKQTNPIHPYQIHFFYVVLSFLSKPLCSALKLTEASLKTGLFHPLTTILTTWIHPICYKDWQQHLLQMHWLPITSHTSHVILVASPSSTNPLSPIYVFRLPSINTDSRQSHLSGETTALRGTLYPVTHTNTDAHTV